jgi:hypothetical protein
MTHTWASTCRYAAEELRDKRARLAEARQLLATRVEAERLSEANVRLAEAHRKMDLLLAHCPDGECGECSKIICDHGDPNHFHHDGCPSCWQDEATADSENVTP